MHQKRLFPTAIAIVLLGSLGRTEAQDAEPQETYPSELTVNLHVPQDPEMLEGYRLDITITEESPWVRGRIQTIEFAKLVLESPEFLSGTGMPAEFKLGGDANEGRTRPGKNYSLTVEVVHIESGRRDDYIGAILGPDEEIESADPERLRYPGRAVIQSQVLTTHLTEVDVRIELPDARFHSGPVRGL